MSIFCSSRIDDTGDSHVLFHPSILDRPGVDAEQPLGQIPERPVRHLLHLQNMLHLPLGEHTLFDQQLSELNPWQICLLCGILCLIGHKEGGVCYIGKKTFIVAILVPCRLPLLEYSKSPAPRAK